ncbi:hypothetical protein [Paenibacillus amylolyticus]|uniref:hypothetical protein n=1 Tax=Paenibacillus amylolyticus TaxID=1451 RepID=UPI00201E2478|nr:hypothetical protein [Paenibacillus amylolyticus]
MNWRAVSSKVTNVHNIAKETAMPRRSKALNDASALQYCPSSMNGVQFPAK